MGIITGDPSSGQQPQDPFEAVQEQIPRSNHEEHGRGLQGRSSQGIEAGKQNAVSDDLFEPRLLQPDDPDRAWENKERETYSVDKSGSVRTPEEAQTEPSRRLLGLS